MLERSREVRVIDKDELYVARGLYIPYPSDNQERFAQKAHNPLDYHDFQEYFALNTQHPEIMVNLVNQEDFMPKVVSMEGIVPYLVESGLLSLDQAKEFQAKENTQKAKLLKQQEKDRRNQKVLTLQHDFKLIDVIASFGFRILDGGGEVLTEDRITQALAEAVELPYHKIDPLKLDSHIVTLVPKRFSLKHGLVPIQTNNDVLTIATWDPFDLEVLDQLKRFTGNQIKLVLSPRSDILKIIDRKRKPRGQIYCGDI